MGAHVLPPLAVNSKSERKVNSLPQLGFEPVIFGMLAHLSNHSAISPTPKCATVYLKKDSIIQKCCLVKRLERIFD
jgi:hypothetical protein